MEFCLSRQLSTVTRFDLHFPMTIWSHDIWQKLEQVNVWQSQKAKALITKGTILGSGCLETSRTFADVLCWQAFTGLHYQSRFPIKNSKSGKSYQSLFYFTHLDIFTFFFDILHFVPDFSLTFFFTYTVKGLWQLFSFFPSQSPRITPCLPQTLSDAPLLLEPSRPSPWLSCTYQHHHPQTPAQTPLLSPAHDNHPLPAKLHYHSIP